MRSPSDQLATIVPVVVREARTRGSTLRPWRTASLSNCVDNVTSCCQSIVPASPLDSTFTPRSDVVPSVLWTDVEPLTVVFAFFPMVAADADDAPTTPATMVATPTHVATNAP